MKQDYDNDSDDDYGKLSKINSAGLINSTLSNLKNDFFKHYRNGEYLRANSDLDCLWVILGGEKDVDPKGYNEIEMELSKTGTLSDSLEIRGFGKVDPKQLEKIGNQKSLLLKKALFLQKLQNQQGKGTAYLDGDDEEAE